MNTRLPTVHAVIGILQKGDCFLLAERPVGKPYSGYWEFPGGKVEASESSEAALKRELHEELGIEVISAEFWFTHTHAYPDKIVLLDIWRVQQFVGEPRAQENQLLRWATAEQIRALHLLAGNWPIINKMLAEQKLS